MPSYREGGRWVSGADRRRASDRLLRAWRGSLVTRSTQVSDALHSLNFSDLCLGDLPELPTEFSHVTQLNLTGVRLTEKGSNAFLHSFLELKTLQIGNNALTHLPDSVGSLEHLRRLEAPHNQLVHSDDFQRQMQRLTNLQWLDLSMNRLDTLDVTGMHNLHNLNVSGNQLARWPEGVGELSELNVLDLRNNQIDSIPWELLHSRHSRLMAGANISNNILGREALDALNVYQDETGYGLGLSRDEIDSQLNYYETDFASSDTESDEELTRIDGETADVQQARWFDGVPDDSPKHVIWQTLSYREGSDSLFHLLAELKHTRDYIEDKALLTARVWEVLTAAYGDPGLCSDLFLRSRSPYTCGDGRILLFSDLEVRVHEFNVLKGLSPSDKGAGLFRLSKSLFRLGKLENIAQRTINENSRIDPAEVRLAYRISLAQRLGLPKQPQDMLYRNVARVSSESIEQAYQEVIAAEQTPEFMEQLVGREYWSSYLLEHYPEEFAALEQRQQVEIDALEERYPVINESYAEAVEALGKKNTAERRQLLVTLSELERSTLDVE